jgi:hypothetical protein
MLKIAALLFNSIALLFYQLFFIDSASVISNVPERAQVGDEFTIEVTINKGAIAGFAKFQQNLPVGLTAVEGENNGAAFTFVNQSVKFIWMSLPKDETIKVSYKVKVSAEAIGTQTITGKFAYVADNVKQSIDIPVSTIVITGEGETPPVAAAIEETPKPLEPPPSAVSNINGSRTLPANVSSTSEFFVEVVINKGNLSGFAKLEETLPEGFKAIEVESKGAVFSFENRKVTYIWGAMPTEAEFVVSYKIQMDPTTNGEKLIDGVFSFVENDQTSKYVLPSSSVKVEGVTPEPVAVVVEKLQETPPVEAVKEVVSENVTPPEELSATTVPSPQGSGNINYKVQILALQKAKDVEAIRSYFKINENVSLEMAQGYTKYTVGQHQEYKSARDSRENFSTGNNIIGPFVVAYNSGARITVQEALMITNQKWYK